MTSRRNITNSVLSSENFSKSLLIGKSNPEEKLIFITVTKLISCQNYLCLYEVRR